MQRGASNRQFKGFTQTEQGKWEGPFEFAVLADPQLGLMDRDMSWATELELSHEAIRHVNRLRPRFAITVGDLVNAPCSTAEGPEGDTDDAQKLHEKQVADLLGAFDKVEVPMMYVAGNHDIGGDPNRSSILRFQKEFGDEYYTFWFGGCLGIVIDTVVYSSPEKCKALMEEQHSWLVSVLEGVKEYEIPPKHIVLFTHYPLFLVHVDESDDAKEIGECKLTIPDPATKEPKVIIFGNHYFHLPTEQRHTLFNLLKRHGVKIIFTGHFHQNKDVDADGIRQVISSAVGMQLGDSESGFTLVRVHEDKFEYGYHGFKDMPTTLKDWKGAKEHVVTPKVDA